MNTTRIEEAFCARAWAVGYLDGRSVAAIYVADADDWTDHAAMEHELLEGDYSSWPRADLSGEWADGHTPTTLARKVGVDPLDVESPEDMLPLICDAYENGFDQGVLAYMKKVFGP